MDSLSPSPSYDGTGWSNLPLDLMYLIFERLDFVDFQRAKSICSSWRYASKQSARPNNHIPWMIRFPVKGQDYCLLLNPEKKDKMYRIRGFGDNFANSHCLATHRSWFLMRDSIRNLYLLNLFTRERIHLPPLEYQHGLMVNNIKSIFLWMDYTTKDYLVVWTINDQTRGDMGLFYCRKDVYWKQFKAYGIIDMVYKDHKLYLYTSSSVVKVLDFSEDTPRQIFKTQVSESIPLLLRRIRHHVVVHKDCLVTAVTGELMRVVGTIYYDISNNYTYCRFSIYKMDLSNSKWDKLTSLGDEAIILDLRISVLANNIEGVKRNSIYFSGYIYSYRNYDYDDVRIPKDTYVFSLDSNTTESPDQSMLCSSIPSSDSRWFVPN